MSMKRNHNYHPIGLSILFTIPVILFFYSCNENPDEFTLGEEFIESRTSFNLIDTFSVNLSTVILDTINTAGTGKIQVGNYDDHTFGKISSSSYFQIGSPESYDVEPDDRYDSLNLVLRYNNDSFGDTNKVQKIIVYQLEENIELADNGNINSHTTYNYNHDPLGAKIYTPKPNSSDDTLFIKISDDIGLDLFSKLKDNSNIVANNESFINYFHGLVLKGDDNYTGAIIGFNAYDVNLILYSTRVAETSETIKNQFALSDSSKQFNNIAHDFTSADLNSLVEQRSELPASEIGGLSYLQGGTGLVIRVDFPSIREILLYNRGKVTDAKLYLAPLKNSYNDFELPSQLLIYETDNLNRINGYALSSSVLTKDELYNEETYYTFDVTEYLNEELSDYYIDPGDGLIITLPFSELSSGFNRMVADSQNQRLKLKIYYLTY